MLDAIKPLVLHQLIWSEVSSRVCTQVTLVLHSEPAVSKSAQNKFFVPCLDIKDAE